MPSIAQQDYIIIDVEDLDNPTEAEVAEIAKYFNRTFSFDENDDSHYTGDLTIFSVVLRDSADNFYRIVTADWAAGFVVCLGINGLIKIEIPLT